MMNGTASKVEDSKVGYQGQTAAQKKDFTQEEFLAKWNLFADRYKEPQPRLYSTLLDHTPTKQGSSELKMIVNNALQENAINDIKSDILIFLRKELENDEITLATEIQEVIVPKSAFTPAEKFRLLNEKNPALGHLRQLFDLDF